jgi:hypothetical protein
MGKQRYQRREAQAGRWWGRHRPGPTRPPLSLDEAVTAAVHGARARPHELPALVDHLAERAQDDGAGRLSSVLTDRLGRAVGDCWGRGWQPADLAHVIGRRLRPAHRQVCALAITLDARSYRHASHGDPAWLAQVDALADSLVVSSTDDPLGLVGRAGGDLAEAILTVVETLAGLHALPTQPRLCPPPSEWGRGPHLGADSPGPRRPRGSGAPDPKMTERVRALLAKAESTDFPDEAEAFTAKAQELIARHAIDVAMLQGGPGEGPHADGRRVLLDDPYAKAKGLLLAAIASANHCRTVRDQRLGICTIFGDPNDLDAVELLYTSLLTQATAAMVTAGRSGPQARSRRYRQSFLVAYATRIGQRLRDATDTAVMDAQKAHGDNVLPVLASREESAKEALKEAFPHLRRERFNPTDPAGWAAGTAAADMARLGPDAELRAG